MRVELTIGTLHPGQQRIVDGRSRFNVVPCGRRFGKTHLLKDLLVDPETLRHPQGVFMSRYKDMLEVWREVVSTFSPIIERKNATERRIELKTGGVIEFWTLGDLDAGRSRKYKRVLCDEVGLVPKMMEVWNYAIRPTLADMVGDAFFFGTPKGRNGFYKMWLWAIDPAMTDWAGFQMPTYENPHIPASEIVAFKQSLPERVYRQEILAEFLDDAGGVFRNVMQCATAAEQKRAISGHSYVIGVDWGKLNDFTVVSVVDISTNSLVYVDRFNQIDYTFQLKRLLNAVELFRPSAVYAESNSMGEALIDQLRVAHGLPVIGMQTTNRTKDAWIQALSIAFEREEIKILNDPVLIAELQAFEAQRLPSGLMKYSAPEGLHDDMVMSLAMAYAGANRLGDSIIIEESPFFI